MDRRATPGRRLFMAATGGTDQAVVFMRGSLDAAARREFDREVSELLAAAPARVVVDMAEVESIDASWLGVLTQLRSRLYDHGEAQVRVSAVSDAARQALEVNGLAALVEMPRSDTAA
jgi:anti-anti-sigma factor